MGKKKCNNAKNKKQINNCAPRKHSLFLSFYIYYKCRIMSNVIVYPSLLEVTKNTIDQIQTKPLIMRALSGTFFIVHILMALVYCYAILFSTNPYTLLLVTIGIFILLELCNRFHGCIFSNYENINGDILPSFSQSVCAVFRPVNTCSETTQYESFILSSGIILALLKIFVLFYQNQNSGKKFRLTLN